MKNRPAIILLFIANSVSGVAQGINMIAIPWYFAQQDNMSTFGMVYMLTNLISFFWVPYGGALVDRYNRKYIFLSVTAICGIILFSIAGYGFYTGALPWYAVASVFMITFFNYSIHYPTLYAFIQEITEPHLYGRITSYIEIQGQLTNMLAGAGGALLLEGFSVSELNLFGKKLPLSLNISPWSIQQIFLLDASTYFFGFVIILFISYSPLFKRIKEKRNIKTELLTGLNYLRSHPNITLFGIASYCVFVAILLEGFYLGAQYVKTHLQEGGDVYAISEMYYAIGAVFAGVAIRRIFNRIPIPLAVIIMTFLTAISFFALTLSKSISILYLVLFLLGLNNSGIRIQRITYLFSKIPNQVYGRTGSIFNMTNILLRIAFLGLFSLPFFHASNNVVYAFYIIAAFLLIAGLILSFYYKRFVDDQQVD